MQALAAGVQQSIVLVVTVLGVSALARSSAKYLTRRRSPVRNPVRNTVRVVVVW